MRLTYTASGTPQGKPEARGHNTGSQFHQLGVPQRQKGMCRRSAAALPVAG